MTIRCLASAAVVAGLGAVCLSCSDPVPPAAQGAVHFKVGRAASDAFTCGRGGEGTIGTVDGEKKSEIGDQTNGASISCTVTPSGGGYAITANVNQGKTTFALSGSISGTTGTGSVTVQAESIAEPILSATSMPCTLTLDTNDGSGLSAAAGRAWIGFTCPLMQDPSDPNPDTSGCGIVGIPAGGKTPPGGFLAVENCAQ